MGQHLVVSRVGHNNWEIECSCNVGGSKCPLTTINGEVDGSRMGDSRGCHIMVEINDHPGVEESTRGHKILQGVPLHKSHRISKLGIDSKSWKIIICFIVHFLGTAI